MTTTIVVHPHGHNIEVVVSERGEETIYTPDPHGTHRYTAYDTKTVLVREIEGWAEKPIEAPRELTFGQKAVGLTFNPSGDQEVARCKQMHADAIDQMNQLRNSMTSAEVRRLASTAITEMQGAQMWAVKALTWRG